MPNPLDSLKALGDQLRAQIGEGLDLDVLRRQEPARPLEELLAELESLPGLESVKDQVRALVAFLRVQARRKEAGPTTAKLADQEKKEPAGRTVDYTVVKPDFFVLSGLQGLKKFYLRGTFKGDEVRILTILYDQAVENTVEPIVIAMSSAFNPFPSGAQAAGPPPRKTVEYGTGIVLSDDGAILTDRLAVDGCLSIVVAGYGNADRTAEDKDHDLALLRIYGARGLKPLALGAGAAKPSVELTGIADPQNQGGGAAVSSVKAQAAQSGGAEQQLSPAPGLGFSGAAALDPDGVFAGVVLLKPVIVAGPTITAAAAQA